ncbi:M14 family metallopeptidase [Candidatus Riflebacteria bacterium]
MLNKKLSLFFVFLILIIASPLFSEGEQRCLVRIFEHNNDKPLIGQIIRDGYEISGHGSDWFDAVVPITYAIKLRSWFKKNKLPARQMRTLIPRVDLEFARYPVGVKKNKGPAYHKVEEVNEKLKLLALEYPQIASFTIVGKSVEGRDIGALKISDNVNENEDEVAVMLMGATHAREWISFEVPLFAAENFCELYGVDQTITSLVNNREIFIIPMVNPDGVHYSQTKKKYWRKNRSFNEGSSYRGVDLNRNYAYKWGNVGASNSPYSDVYHGTGPFTQPEAISIRDLAIKEKFSASLSFHSYSQLNLYPFGYDYNVYTPDQAILIKMARGMAQFNGYTAQNSADLYPAMGDSDDWLYGTMKSLSFTIELGTTFIPNPAMIHGICEKNFKAILYFVDKAAEFSLIIDHPERDKLIQNLTLKEKGELLLALLDEQLARRINLLKDPKNDNLLNVSLDRTKKLKTLESNLVNELLAIARKDTAKAREFIDFFRAQTTAQEDKSRKWMGRHFERKLGQALKFQALTDPDFYLQNLLDYLNY